MNLVELLVSFIAILYALSIMAQPCVGFSIMQPLVGYRRSFSLATGSTTSATTTSSTTSLALRRSPNNEEPLRSPDDEIPQLPAFGATSYDAATTPSSNNNSKNNANDEQKAAFVGRKFELQYTCKICDTRNCHKVSRIAYNKGVVIATCKGCMSQHLISDNLGYTQQFDGNLEDYFAEQGSEESVTRVNEDVFHLERILGMDTKGGTISGPDGERYLD